MALPCFIIHHARGSATRALRNPLPTWITNCNNFELDQTNRGLFHAVRLMRGRGLGSSAARQTRDTVVRHGHRTKSRRRARHCRQRDSQPWSFVSVLSSSKASTMLLFLMESGTKLDTQLNTLKCEFCAPKSHKELF
jgi:hypothetical protein